MNIILCGTFFPDVQDYLRHALPADDRFNIRVWDGRTDALPKEIDVMVPMMHRIDADLMDRARPRLIQQWGSGLEGVDLDHARKLGIAVTNVAATGGNADSVAEHAILLILSLLRRLNLAQANVKSEQLGTPVGKPLSGKTVCLYGLGAIALPLSRLLKAFGVRLIGLTRDPEAAKVEDFGLDACYSTADKDACLRESEILVICLRQSKGDRSAIGRHELKLLPKGALLVNIARGGLVDYDALFEGLKDGHLGGAGMDVFWTEPFDGNDPLLELENVIATPHVAGITTSSMSGIARGVADNILRLEAGYPLLNRAS